MNRTAFLILGLVAITYPAIAQSVPSPIFFEWGVLGGPREILYPEMRYESNPAAILDLESPFIRPKLRTSTEGEFDGLPGWYTRTEYDTVANDRIARTETSRPLEMDVGARFFLPHSDVFAFGADTGYDRRSRSSLAEQDAGWAGSPDDLSTELNESDWRVRGAAFAATRFNAVDAGLMGGGHLFRRPGDLQIQRSLVNGQLTQAIPLADDRTRYGFDAAAGIRFPADRARIGVAGRYEYSMDQSVPWEQDDSDPTSIVPITQNSAVDEQLDETVTTGVTANLSFELPLSSQVRLVASGDLPVVFSTVTERYERVSDSKELERTTIDRSTVSNIVKGAFSFSLGVGVSWQPKSNIDLRAGTVFSTDSQEATVETYASDGARVNPANTSGAPSVALGSDPVEENTILGFGFVQASRSNTFTVDVTCTYSPPGPITVFLGGALEVESVGRWFEVFNSTTAELLSAYQSQRFRDVELVPTVGGAFEFRDGTLLSLSAEWAKTALSINWFDQDLSGFPPAGDFRQRDTSVAVDVILRL